MESHADRLKNDGFCVVESFLDPESTTALAAASRGFLADETLRVFPLPFKALGSKEATQALRDSVHTIRLFGESRDAIQTVGHGICEADDRFADVSTASVELLRMLGRREDRVVQSKLVTKLANVGAVVPPHTDSQYIFSEPESGVAVWIALDASTRANGCVQVVPKSHVDVHPGSSRFELGPDDDVAVFAHVAHGVDDENLKRAFKKKKETFLPLEMKAGDALIMDSKLWHFSERNASQHDRIAFTLHLVDSTTTFLERNWLNE